MVRAQTSTLSVMILSCTCFPHESIMPNLTYNRVNSAIINKRQRIPKRQLEIDNAEKLKRKNLNFV